MDDEMKRELQGIKQALAAVATETYDSRNAVNHLAKDLAKFKVEIKTDFTELHDELRSEIAGSKAGVIHEIKRLSTRFEDFLAQDEAARDERRRTLEALVTQQRQLDNHEKRLQRFEARRA